MRPSELPTLEGEFVAVDTETSGLHPDDGARVSVVSVAWEQDGSIVSYAFPFDQGILDKLNQGSLFDLVDDVNLPESEWAALLDWLQEQRLVFHNAKFDLLMLNAGTRHWEGRDLDRWLYWDTMVVQHVIDPLNPVGLKAVADRLKLLGGDERDKEGALKRHMAAMAKLLGLKASEFSYDLADWSVLGPYAARDAELTIALFQWQLAALDENLAPRERIQFQMDLCRTLLRMERRGMAFDVDRCLLEATKLQARREKLVRELPFSPPTIPRAKQYFFVEKKIEPIKITEKGAPQLDDEVQAALVKRGVAGAEVWQSVTKIDKALSMWYLGWPSKIGPDGRLRATFKQTQVKTGRMSVERVQLHAVPKNDKKIEGVDSIRSMFKAREGYQLWNLDLSQAELRVATKFSGCKLMQEMLDGGADLHGITTTEIFGIQEGHPEWKYKRDIAKRLTFGGIFQIGARTFQATLSKLAGIQMPLDECDVIVQRWRSMYPEFGRAYYSYMNAAERQGWVELIGGERSYFIPGRDQPRSAWSRRVQGSLAKAAMMWIVQVEAMTDEALLMTVHDSAVLELPLDDDYTAYRVADAGAELLTRLFKTPMKVDVGGWDGPVKQRQYDAVSGRRA